MQMARFKAQSFLLFCFAVVLGLGGCGPKDTNRVDVTVIVDFGPATRPQLQKEVKVPERSTVFETLKAAFPVVTSGR